MSPTTYQRPLKIDLRDDDVLFFLHIPKTAGMSLISVLEKHFRPDQIMPLHSYPSHEKFQNYPPDARARFRLMRGHFRAGAYSFQHRYIVQNPIVLTVMRDPVERTISAYRHIRRHTNNPLHEELNRKDISLMEYVTNPKYSFHTRDFQTWMIAGAVIGNTILNNVILPDETRFEIARQRLEQFAWVGLTHRFRESLDLLSHTLGWEHIPSTPRENTAPEYSTRGSVDAATLEAIASNVRFDLELFRFAERLFEDRLTQMKRAVEHGS